jgi:type VI secretion system secreted protein VgrG
MAVPVILGQDHLDSVPFENLLDDWAVHVGWATRDVPTSRGESPVDRARLGLVATKPRDELAATQLDDAGVRRAIALKAAAITVEGVSDCRHLRHGARIKLADHPDSELDGSYLVTWVEHRGRQSPPDEPGFSSGDEPPYGNRFGGCPADLPWRPPIRPAPPMESVHLGTVVGPEGEEIHCDPLGRVKVRFLWDASPGLADSASAWVRVMQPWAGNGWGHVTIPRVGQEVVVGYVDGNPNEPVVLGTLYNGTHKPPYTLPEHKTRFGIKSRSTPSGTDSNEIRFEDKKGSENFYLHASNSMTTAVDGDASRTVGHDDNLTVDNLRKVQAKNIEVHTKEDHVTNVGRSYTLSATKDGVIKTPSMKILATTGEGAVVIEASTSILLRVGGSELRLEPARITLSSPNVSISGTATVQVEGPDVHVGQGANGLSARGGTIATSGSEVTVHGAASVTVTGASVTSEATASNAVRGAQVEVNGSGGVQVRGASVRLN